jgi:hypothetical protein
MEHRQLQIPLLMYYICVLLRLIPNNMKSIILILMAVAGSVCVAAQTFTWIDVEETGYNLNPSAVNYIVSAAPD